MLPDVKVCDVVAVPVHEPAQGEEPGTAGEVGLALREVTTGAGERLRVARAGVGESDRLVVETCFLGGGEPFRLVSGVVAARSAKSSWASLCGYFLATARKVAR